MCHIGYGKLFKEVSCVVWGYKEKDEYNNISQNRYDTIKKVYINIYIINIIIYIIILKCHL